jgi:rhodanese-related sulfurtransferase
MVLLSLFVCLAGGCTLSFIFDPIVDEQVLGDVSPADALSLIEENSDNPDFVILDVRTADEFSSGHIENAINLDYYSDSFIEELAQLDTEKAYLIYCGSGGRSADTLDIMEQLDFMEVYNLTGGMTAWEAAGYPTTSADD